MSCQFLKSADDDYLTLFYTGKVNREIIFDNTIKAHKFGRKNGIKKYFTDLTKAINTDDKKTVTDFIAIDMKKSAFIDKEAVVAIFVAPDDNSHDFIEAVSEKNGYNVKLFRDREKAIKYLQETKNPAIS